MSHTSLLVLILHRLTATALTLAAGSTGLATAENVVLLVSITHYLTTAYRAKLLCHLA
jgi:hypothetical protein